MTVPVSGEQLEAVVHLPSQRNGQAYERAALVARAARRLLDAVRRPAADDETAGEVDTVRLLPRAALRRRGPGRVPAQRPAVLRALGARARATGRSPTSPPLAPMRCGAEVAADQGPRLQRRPRAPEDRGPALPVLGDRLGLLVWGEMPSAYEFSPAAVNRMIARVDGGGRRDPSHPCDRDLGAAQRELGRPAHRATTPSERALRTDAVPPDQDARPDPAGHLQRRLGAHSTPTSGRSTTTSGRHPSCASATRTTPRVERLLRGHRPGRPADPALGRATTVASR